MSTLKLGRRPRRYNPAVPHLSALIGGRRLAPPPPEVDYSRALPTNLGMMGNDSLGDCLVGDTLAVAPSLTRAYRVFYNGPIVSIVTGTGKRLSATRNHHVLTTRGFVPMRSLHVGDHVVGTDLPQAVAVRMGDYLDQAPSQIKDMFESYRRIGLSGAVKRQMHRAIDFHGDARCFKGEIDVVEINRLLQRGDMAAFRQPERQESLVLRGRTAEALDSLRATGTHPVAISSPTSSRMSFGGLGAALVGGELPRPKQAGFAGRPHLYASPSQSRIQPLSADSKLCGEFLDSFPGDVALDRIVQIEECWIRDHVYDLSTERNWYIANGIITHNCTCAAFYHALQAWSANANPPIDTEPDANAVLLYEECCGYVPSDPSTDQGGDEQSVLTYLVQTGAPVGANGTNRHHLAAFIEIDPRNADDVKTAIAECGLVYIGLNVPAFMSMSPGTVWDVDPSGDQSIVGGHAVISAKYDTDTKGIISWGSADYSMTDAFWAQYVDECYGLIDGDWIEATGKTPFGLTLAQLEQQMQALKATT